MESLMRNSYVMLVISFIMLSAVFYVTGVGCTIIVKDGKVERHFGWRYPVALSLVIWVIWHYWLFPPGNDYFEFGSESESAVSPKNNVFGQVGGHEQRINMINWN